jgi:hypothetical protein
MMLELGLLTSLHIILYNNAPQVPFKFKENNTMKQWLACIALISSCFVPSASAQDAKMLNKFSFGIDFSVQPGGISRDYAYTNSDVNTSGTDYRDGNAIGGTAQFKEGKGWVAEARMRRQSIGNPIDWTQVGNQPRQYQNGFLSNAVQQFSGSYSAVDVIQQIPVLGHKTQKHGFSIGVVAGATNVRSVIKTVTTIFSPNAYYDAGTVTSTFWGPKGGAKVGYADKWFAVSSELTIGFLREHGNYTDVQGPYTDSGITYLGPYVYQGTIWSREVNSRSSLTVPVTAHFALKATYEKRSDSNANGYYIFGTDQVAGTKISETLGSTATMIGFVFYL